MNISLCIISIKYNIFLVSLPYFELKIKSIDYNNMYLSM